MSGLLAGKHRKSTERGNFKQKTQIGLEGCGNDKKGGQEAKTIKRGDFTERSISNR